MHFLSTLTFEVTGPDLNPGKYIDVSRAAAAVPHAGKKEFRGRPPGWPPPPGTNNFFARPQLQVDLQKLSCC
jgi:hypothetical protein